MNKFIHTLLFCVLSPWLMAQYTYFNHGYDPPYPEVGSGESTNLIVRGDSLLVYGFHPFDSEFGRSILILDQTGTLLQTLNIGVGNDIHITDFSDTVYPFADGYVWSGGNNQFPFIIWMDDQFNEIHRTEKPELFTDTTYSTFFTSCISQNGNLISTGRRVYDLIPEVPGQDFTNLLLAKHDELGNEIWFHEYTVAELGVTGEYSGPFAYPRGGTIESNNGEILVFGSIGNDLDCFVFKFDPEGNYLDHVHWGSNIYSDGSPWPIQVAENEFLLAYTQTEMMINDVYTSKPRFGILNSDDMTVQLNQSMDFPTEYGIITDFEKTADGNFLMLGFGAPEIDGEMMYAYMIKVDMDGNVEWYKTYEPNIPHLELNAYDLEITQDGGFAFVGNYRHAETGDFFNWVVKTDACGEEIFNGCQAVIGVVEEKTSNTGLSLYPNPANALLMIDYKPAGIYSINIYDTMGKLVLQQNTDPFATQFLVDLSELSTSIYEVRLSEVDDTFRTSAIFIKE